MRKLMDLRRFCISLLIGLVGNGSGPIVFAQAGFSGSAESGSFAGYPADSPSLPVTSWAEPLELEQAVHQSVQWHPAITEAIGQLYQRQQDITISRAGYYPRLQGGVRTGYDNTWDERRSSQALVLSVSQMLYDFGKISNRVRAAEASVAFGQANFLYTVDQIARDTAYAVIEIQRYQMLSRMAEEQVEGVLRIQQLAEQRSIQGASARSDAVQAHSRLEGARVTSLQYHARLQRWRAHLASLLGDTGRHSVTDSFPAELMQSCDRAESDPQRVPEFLMALARQAEATAQRAVARAENRPTISLEPALTHYLDDSYRSGPNQERTQWGVFLNVNVPAFQGGSHRARERAADFALRSAEAGLSAARLAVQQGLVEAFTQTASLERSLDFLARRDTSISETRDLYRQQYLALGTRTLLDLLNAEQEIHQSRFERQNTISDLRRMQIDCLYHTGELRDAFALTHLSVQGVEIIP